MQWRGNGFMNSKSLTQMTSRNQRSVFLSSQCILSYFPHPWDLSVVPDVCQCVRVSWAPEIICGRYQARPKKTKIRSMHILTRLCHACLPRPITCPLRMPTANAKLPRTPQMHSAAAEKGFLSESLHLNSFILPSANHTCSDVHFKVSLDCGWGEFRFAVCWLVVRFVPIQVKLSLRCRENVAEYWLYR